jgi:TRAP-type C4-dicarboxylate transport system permease small subunit
VGGAVIMKKILKVLGNLDEYIQPVFFAILLVVVILQICARFIHKLNLPWTLEVITFTFNASVWFAVSLGIKTYSHVGIDILLTKVSQQWLRWLLIFQYSLFMFVLIAFLWAGTMALYGYYLVSDLPQVLKVPLFIMRSPIIFGCLFSIFRCIQQILLIIKNEFDYSRFREMHITLTEEEV